MSVTDDLKKLNDDDLALRIVGLNRETQQSLLAKWDWERRKVVAQHEFNMQLLAQQARLNKSNMRIIAIASILAAILGAITGFELQVMHQEKLKPTTPKEALTPSITNVFSSSIPPR